MPQFDLLQIPVPFAMRPGLERLAVGTPQLTLLQPGSALALEKAAAWQHPNACLFADALDADALRLSWAALASQAQKDAIKFVATNPTNTATNSQKHVKDALQSLSMAVQEDLALLDGRPSSATSGCLAWLNVTCPSHWAPEEKIGLPLVSVHAPVADNTLLLQANAHLVKLATSGERWQRWVWTITPSPLHDAHPARHPGRAWPALDATQPSRNWLSKLYLRHERQTFFPVLADNGQPSGMAIFTIRVGIEPLPSALKTTEHAQRLLNSLQSMSPAVLAYKGLLAAQPLLLQALSAQIAAH
jgi:dimethylamine monooxygenase subunit A